MNTYQEWQVYTNETLMILKNKLTLLGNVNRDNEHLFAKKGMKAGNTINLRKPARFVGRTGEAYNAEAYVENSYPVVIRPLQGVDIDIPATEWTLSLDEIKQRVLAPAAAQLVNNIERDCLQIAYQSVYNNVGVPGTTPTALKTYNQARAQLVLEGFADTTANTLIISPDMQVEIASTLSALFNPGATVDTAFKNGLIGQGYGFKWYESANLWTQIAGTRVAGAGSLSAAPALGATTLALTGFGAAATFKKGDTFTLASTNGVNPMVRASFGKLRKFTVVADATADGSGNLASLLISPAINFSGPQQNVDIQPASNAALVFDSAASISSVQGIAFNPNAFTWACVDQIQPGGVDQAFFATDKDTGIQLRFVRQYEGRTNTYINRFDVLYAFGVPYPEGAVRVNSLT